MSSLEERWSRQFAAAMDKATKTPGKEIVEYSEADRRLLAEQALGLRQRAERLELFATVDDGVAGE